MYQFSRSHSFNSCIRTCIAEQASRSRVATVRYPLSRSHSSKLMNAYVLLAEQASRNHVRTSHAVASPPQASILNVVEHACVMRHLTKITWASHSSLILESKLRKLLHAQDALQAQQLLSLLGGREWCRPYPSDCSSFNFRLHPRLHAVRFRGFWKFNLY